LLEHRVVGAFDLDHLASAGGAGHNGDTVAIHAERLGTRRTHWQSPSTTTRFARPWWPGHWRGL
jgi:hypothetical protein